MHSLAIHRPLRPAFHRTVRCPFRRPFRQRWGSPDELARALTCFRRAIRAHRRLNKLAPHEFDAAVIDRDRAERLERQARYLVIDAALEKVYGPATPEERARQRHQDWLAAQPPRLHPRTRRAAEREHAQWQFWMEAGRSAWARHQQRRPHATPSLSRVARLLQIASDLGRLAVVAQASCLRVEGASCPPTPARSLYPESGL